MRIMAFVLWPLVTWSSSAQSLCPLTNSSNCRKWCSIGRWQNDSPNGHHKLDFHSYRIRATSSLTSSAAPTTTTKIIRNFDSTTYIANITMTNVYTFVSHNNCFPIIRRIAFNQVCYDKTIAHHHPNSYSNWIFIECAQFCRFAFAGVNMIQRHDLDTAQPEMAHFIGLRGSQTSERSSETHNNTAPTESSDKFVQENKATLKHEWQSCRQSMKCNWLASVVVHFSIGAATSLFARHAIDWEQWSNNACDCLNLNLLTATHRHPLFIESTLITDIFHKTLN